MEIKYEKSYWPNSVGFIGFCLFLSIFARSCTDMFTQREQNETSITLKKEETKQLELKLKYAKK